MNFSLNSRPQSASTHLTARVALTAALLAASTWLWQPAHAAGLQQPLSASGFYLGNDPGTYFVSFDLQGRPLKVGEEIDAVNSAGKRARMKIKSIETTNAAGDRQKVSTWKVGEEGSMVVQLLQGNMKDFVGTLYLVDRDAPLPGAVAAKTEAKEQARDAARGRVAARLDGANWPLKVASSGAAFYANGLAMLKTEGHPMLVMAFNASQAPDSRQLMVTVHDHKPKLGLVPQDKVEVAITGNAGTDATKLEWKGINGTKTAGGKFRLEITRWEPQGSDRALLSAKFSGSFPSAISGKNPAQLSDGIVEDLVVDVHQRSR